MKVLSNTLRFAMVLMFVSATACAEEGSEDVCDRFEIDRSESSFHLPDSVETDITNIKTGKLFYREKSGACVPTIDTYLVVFLNRDLPRIAALLPGHTVTLETIDVDSRVYLAARYFAGGNQYVLSIFDVEKGDLTPIPGPNLASNIRSIAINGSQIVIQNQITGEDGVREVVKAEYKIEDGTIIASE